MKAEEGKTYALIENACVRQVFTIFDLPEWHDGLHVVEITGLSDISCGDLYIDGEFVKTPAE